MKVKNKIAVLGLWHLGLVEAVCFAHLDKEVVGYDEDREKIKLLNSGQLPIYEPNLEKYLQENLRKKRLRFTSRLEEVKDSNIVIIAVDTPLNEQDQVNLKPIFNLVKNLEQKITQKTIVIISSQVPIGTSEKLEAILNRNKKNIKVAYIPENLRLGKAIERFFKPSMIVIGTAEIATFKEIEKLYQKIKAPKIFTKVKTAEFVKHSINTFLANSISWANELGNLADLVGADFWAVAKIIKNDERIGGFARIFPGLGFAGGTLARDLKILQKLGKKTNYQTTMVDAILNVNERQKKWVVNTLRRIYGSKLKRKKIGILGLTYTPNTSTLRRSLSVETIKKLSQLKVNVQAFDPQANPQEIKKSPKIKTVNSWQELAKDADALVLMTQWPDFLNLPWLKIKNLMHQPLILDAQNFLPDEILKAKGFQYIGLGRGDHYEKI